MNNKLLTITCVIIFIGALLIGYNFIYLPQIRGIENKKNQLKEEIKKNEIAYQIRDVEQEMDKIRKKLPDSPDSSWMMSKVSKIVKQSNIELVSIRPKESVKFDNFDIILVELKVRGSFHDFSDFVSRLESSEEFLKIDFFRQGKIAKQSQEIQEEKDQQESEESYVTDSKGNIITEIDMVISTYYIEK